jgi:hypothetical protein
MSQEIKTFLNCNFIKDVISASKINDTLSIQQLIRLNKYPINNFYFNEFFQYVFYEVPIAVSRILLDIFAFTGKSASTNFVNDLLRFSIKPLILNKSKFNIYLSWKPSIYRKIYTDKKVTNNTEIILVSYNDLKLYIDNKVKASYNDQYLKNIKSNFLVIEKCIKIYLQYMVEKKLQKPKLSIDKQLSIDIAPQSNINDRFNHLIQVVESMKAKSSTVVSESVKAKETTIAYESMKVLAITAIDLTEPLQSIPLLVKPVPTYGNIGYKNIIRKYITMSKCGGLEIIYRQISSDSLIPKKVVVICKLNRPTGDFRRQYYVILSSFTNARTIYLQKKKECPRIEIKDIFLSTESTSDILDELKFQMVPNIGYYRSRYFYIITRDKDDNVTLNVLYRAINNLIRKHTGAKRT